MKKLLIGLLALGSISSFACTDLNKEVRAHTTTWTTLFSMKQINTNFKSSGRIPVNSLSFASLDNQSRMLVADQLNNILVAGRGAEHTGSKNMIQILEESINSNSTVCDLAEKLDANYKFWGE